MPAALSYPKNRIKVQLLKGILPIAKAAFEQEGYQVDFAKRSLTDKGLAKKIKEVSILGDPTNRPITKEVLKEANRLIAIGVFGGGVHQIDLEACARKGIVVFHAPYTNTRSLVELAMGEIIMLLRRIPSFAQEMRRGEWNHSAENCYEIRGKKLGIIGYGNAGTQLSVLAESLGMDVYYYDMIEKQAIGNATKCKTMRELLRKVDVVSLNVDARADNAGFFDAKAFKAMRNKAMFCQPE